MKRLLHALAALWSLPTRTGPSPCQSADLPIRELAKSQPSASAQKANGVKRRPDERSDIGISASTLKKKTIFHLERRYCNVLAFMTLFMCLITAYKAPAQTGAAVNMDEIKPLQIGDTIPEELWHLPLQVVNHPEGRETITLNDYRGKLIILDFWGTFCGSCIAAMPKIAEVHKQFADDMVVIPVSWSKPEATEQMLQNHATLAPLSLSSVVEAQLLIDAFPHGVVPHYAWISPRGEVVATTATNDVTQDNIAKVLQGDEPDYALKTYIDPDKPLLFASEVLPKGAEMQHYSVFIAGSMPSLGGGTYVRKTANTIHGYSIYNRSLLNMYQLIAAKAKGDSITVIGGIGRKRLVLLDSMGEDERYTVDFIVPPSKTDSLYAFMLASLNQHSGYTGQWVMRTRRCLVLTRIGNGLTSKGNKAGFKSDSLVYRLVHNPISRLVKRLNWEDISDKLIVLDETQHEEPVDIVLHAPFHDLNHIRRQLNEQGLDLIEAERDVELFEIRKTPMPNPHLAIN